MAEYINYGDQQIDQQALLTAMADNVQSYVNSQTWSNKRKEKFLNAYQDMLSGGIKGASIENGTWGINIGNNIDLNTMGKKDREMYQEAAYFIQNQMKNLLPKPEENKPEKEKKKDKVVFDNKTFQDKLKVSIINDLFGGQTDKFTKEWSNLDSPQSNGLFSRKKRAEALSKYLNSLSINEEDYDFEKSPYGSYQEYTNRLRNAIEALKTPDTAKNSLYALGLDYDEWLSDGSKTVVGTDEDGKPITLGDQIQQQIEEEEKKRKEAELKEALRAYREKLGNQGALTTSVNNNAIEAKNNTQGYQDYINNQYSSQKGGIKTFNSRLQTLLEKSYNNGKGNGLDSKERKELGNMLFYITTYNPKYINPNLTQEDINHLMIYTSKSMKNILKGKNIHNTFRRLPFQTSDGRYIYIEKGTGNVYFLKPKKHAKITTTPMLDTNKIKEYNDYINNFGKQPSTLYDKPVFKQGGNIQKFEDGGLFEGLPKEAQDELLAIAADAVALVDPEPISGTIAALTAAAFREKNRKWDIHNPGTILDGVTDWTSALAGGLPGIGDVASGYKVTAKLGNLLHKYGKKLVPIISGSLGGFTASTEIVDKLINDKPLTWGDMQSLLVGLAGISAGIKTRAYEKARTAYMKAPKKRGKEPKVDTWFTTGGITRPSWKTQKEVLNSNDTWKLPNFLTGNYNVTYKKQGGTIDKQRIQKYKEYIKK